MKRVVLTLFLIMLCWLVCDGLWKSEESDLPEIVQGEGYTLYKTSFGYYAEIEPSDTAGFYCGPWNVPGQDTDTPELELEGVE